MQLCQVDTVPVNLYKEVALRHTRAAIPDVAAAYKGIPLNTQERAFMRQMRGTSVAEQLPMLTTSAAFMAVTPYGKKQLILALYSQLNNISLDLLYEMSPGLQQAYMQRQGLRNLQTT